jgi:VWFA-related protein
LRVSAWFLLAVISLSYGVRAEAQEETVPIFRDAVDVRVVNLEVVVTDGRGMRVSGIPAGAFRLFIDGVETSVDYFTEVTEGHASSSRQDDSPAPSLPAGETVGRSYVVFIDEFFSMPRDRDEIVRSLMGELPRMEQGDRMAVVAYDGRELALLSHWSSSPDHLYRTFEQALTRPARGRERQTEQRPVASPQRRHMVGPSASPGALDLDTIPDVESMRDVDLKMAVRRMEQQLEAATAAAAATLRTFSDVPGRKVMLLLSGGWPQSPAEMIADNPRTELPEFWTDAEAVYGRLTAAANRLGFTIYPVDVVDSTVRFGLVTSQQEDGRSWMAESQQGGIQTSEGLSSGSDLLRGSQLRRTLELLASRTGGRALIGSDRGKVLATVSDDTSSYYWLGFTPQWSEDDRPRQIRVEVDRPGVRVRTRSSYLDLSPKRSVAMLMEGALLFDTAPRHHKVPVRLGEAKRVRREFELPISVAVPVDEIVFLPVGGRFVADLELHLTLRDSGGRQSEELAPIPFTVRLDQAPPPGTYVRYDTRIRLRRESHRIVVAVRDKVGGAVLTGTSEFRP